MNENATLEIPILFEDGYLLIVEKPTGILSEGNWPSIELWAKNAAKNEPSAHRRNAILLHRLDKPASGILVIAKTIMAAKNVQLQMLNNQFQKRYYCLVKGDASHLKGNLENYVIKDALSKKCIAATKMEKGAKKAVLHINSVVFNKTSRTSLIDVNLITGRYHQIRFQLNQLGFPILGDGLYAPNDWNEYSKIALHAYSIVFMHPKTLEQIAIKSVPVGDFWDNWKPFFK